MNIASKLFVKLCARPCFAKINKRIATLSLRGLGIGNYEDASISGEQWFLSTVIRRFPNPVILDIGANAGHYTELAMRCVPGAQIVAFEPNPYAFGVLSQRHAGNRSVTLERIALSNVCGESILFDRADTSPGSEHASLVRQVFSDHHHVEVNKHIVDTCTLDSYILKNNLSRIDFVKIDVEGHEFSVLEGARESISNRAISLIQFEFSDLQMPERHYLNDYIQLLPNFYFYRLLPCGLLPLRNEGHLYREFAYFQNIIASSNELC